MLVSLHNQQKQSRNSDSTFSIIICLCLNLSSLLVMPLFFIYFIFGLSISKYIFVKFIFQNEIVNVLSIMQNDKNDNNRDHALNFFNHFLLPVTMFSGVFAI